jgi:RNA polymerase sigma-70 factor (ECF subfamily)
VTSPAEQSLIALVRDERRRVLATLVRTTGDVGIAEDAVQDAVVRALETWPRDGVPDEPRAWLTVTARRRAIDLLRREAARNGKEVEAVRLDALSQEDPPTDSVVRDDLLRLVFTCCHPALSPEAQVALSLRTLCGLTTAEVARALLVPEETMAKRLTRARQKIARAGIPYRVPSDHELPARITSVATTVYLVFNEGYAATAGEVALRDDLAAEAIRLARLLVSLMPDEPSLIGLLALLLLQHARRDARVDEHGELVPLSEQDRSTWDAALIEEGMSLVGLGIRRTPDNPDRFVVQAAIAACHALAPLYGDTDWDAIVSWYDVLLRLDPSPVVALGRAVAIGERDGPAGGLVAVDAVDGLRTYGLWHAARAELLHRLARKDEALASYDEALALPLNAAQQRFLSGRRALLGLP